MDDSAFHDEADAGGGGDVGEGVAVDGDDVGEEPGFELADLAGPAEEFGSVEEVGAEDVEGGHAVLVHEDEFAGLGAVGEGADVGADGEGDAGGDLALELLDVEGQLSALGGFAGFAPGVVGEVFGDLEGGDGGDLFPFHGGHGAVGEVVGVVDGFDAGLDGVPGAGLAGGVDGDAVAGAGVDAVGFRHGGAELVDGVLEGGVEVVAGEGVGAGLVDLGEVGALFALGADGGDKLVGGVGAVGIGEDVLGGVEAVGVLVPAEDVDGHAGHPHARAGDHAGVDGVADGGVGGAGAFGAHVAFGGEAGHEVGGGGAGGDESALGDAFFDGLEVFGTGVEEEVDVGVDEAGHEGAVAEVDDLGTGGVGDVRGDLGDAVAGDEDLGGGDEAAGGDVEHVGGAQDDDLPGFGELGGGGKREGEGCCQRDAGGGGHGVRSIPPPVPLPPYFVPKVFERSGLGWGYFALNGRRRLP